MACAVRGPAQPSPRTLEAESARPGPARERRGGGLEESVAFGHSGVLCSAERVLWKLSRIKKPADPVLLPINWTSDR